MNMPEYKMPPCQICREKTIGKGGNGTVYIANDQQFVCKVFNVDDGLSKEKKEKRYKRFCQEILTQKRLFGKINGVLPIEDYSYTNSLLNDKPAWFMMPKAERFSVHKKKRLDEKLKDMIELGQILAELHSLNIAHRDIKPDNILKYNNKIHLSDYGLVWISGESKLTNVPERMGPIKIIPPELESCEDINGCDYMKSDVYLFAKVVWMYIKGDNGGFKGPYNRGASQIYLDSKKYNFESFEPLHEMMMEATKDDWSKRSGISDCLEYLKEQLLIVRGEINNDELNKLKLKENLDFFNCTVSSDYKVYEEVEKIRMLLDVIIPQTEIHIDDGPKRTTVKPKKYKYLTEEVVALYEEQPDRRFKRTLINIIRAEIHKNEIVFETSHIDNANIQGVIRERDVVFAGKVRLVVECSFKDEE